MSENKRTESMEVHQSGKQIYTIHFKDSFSELPELLKDFDIEKRKICVVTDEQVGAIYAGMILDLLTPKVRGISLFKIPAGEEQKTLDTVKHLYEHMIMEQMDRKDLLLALGGGVIGDLTGYTAATYLRGIRFIQIPTTLLSQVDSSIGGKTGVDFDQYKNMVGAFHQPSFVYMNLTVLNTLDNQQFASGMAEIIKHGIIRSAAFYEWLKENRENIRNREFAALKEMIIKSCDIKRTVVEKDPTEQGERALLNFGHTLGHAVEKLRNFTQLHGECVAVGMVGAAYISYLRGMISEADLLDIEKTLTLYQLPTTIEGLETDAIIKTTKYDKKMYAGQIRFILLSALGQAVMDDTVTEDELEKSIQYIKKEQ